MARTTKSSKRRPTKAASRSKSLKTKAMPNGRPARKHVAKIVDPRVQQQMRQYEEAVRHFHQQKFHKAREGFEKVLTGPSKELTDRAQMHLRVCQQRIARLPEANPRTADQHYQHGVAMMNLGRWDEAREHLLRARKLSPKADYIVYAMAALDCLTGEAESAMENLKLAIDLRPENRYHARNDEDFAFLQEDPRFTELLYPEREASGN